MNQNLKNKGVNWCAWMEFKKFINEQATNAVITRQQLKAFLYDEQGLFGRISETTMDQYRRTLTWLGYLKEVEKADGTIMRGKYEVVKHIPEDLPSSVAYKEKRTSQNPNDQGEI